MRRSHVTADRQAQSKTKRLGADWRVVQAGAHLRSDPWTGVLHQDLHAGGRSVAVRTDQQPAALRHRIRGIDDQIEQCLAHSPAVDAEPAARRRSGCRRGCPDAQARVPSGRGPPRPAARMRAGAASSGCSPPSSSVEDTSSSRRWTSVSNCATLPDSRASMRSASNCRCNFNPVSGLRISWASRADISPRADIRLRDARRDS